MNMTGPQYTVYLPDSSSPKSFSKNFTPEEVRSALVSSGYTQVENATLTLEGGGNTIRFSRPTGGTKGVLAA